MTSEGARMTDEDILLRKLVIANNSTGEWTHIRGDATGTLHFILRDACLEGRITHIECDYNDGDVSEACTFEQWDLGHPHWRHGYINKSYFFFGFESGELAVAIDLKDCRATFVFADDDLRHDVLEHIQKTIEDDFNSTIEDEVERWFDDNRDRFYAAFSRHMMGEAGVTVSFDK